jgi:glycosyltransferase involved in cell wall biosynthesis
MSMKRDSRILFVDNSVDSFRRDRMQLVYAARDRGWEVHIAAPAGKTADTIVREGFPFHEVRMTRKGTSIWSEPLTILSLYSMYRRIRPTLVHHLRLKPVLYGSIAAACAGVPGIVNTVTGLGFLFTNEAEETATLRTWVKRGCRAAFRRRNLRVTFQNPDDRAFFIREGIVSGDQAIIIKGSGVDVSLFHPSAEPEGHPVVLLASRMLWDKGVAQFVQAAQELRTEGIQARFVLVGDVDPGNPASIPASQLESWKESGIVEWWGFRKDMPEILARSHIVCLPSYREGIPRILIEAAAAGKPILTTDAPGCRELIRPGENGLLVRVGDAADLRNSLRVMIENPQMRIAMGEKNRDLAVQEFAQELVVSQFMSIYDDLLMRSESATHAIPRADEQSSVPDALLMGGHILPDAFLSGGMTGNVK